MDAAAPLPTAAKFVVLYALIFGAWGLIEFGVGASTGTFNFTTTLLLLPVGLGLMASSNGWRAAGRLVFAIQILLAPILLILLLAARSNGTPAMEPSPPLILLGIAHLAFSLWVFTILGRRDVRTACNSRIAYNPPAA